MATVHGLMCSVAPIVFVGNPCATSDAISRWRGLNGARRGFVDSTSSIAFIDLPPPSNDGKRILGG